MSQVFDRRDGSLLGRFVRRDVSLRYGEIVVFRHRHHDLATDPILRNGHLMACDAIIVNDRLGKRLSMLPFDGRGVTESEYNAGTGSAAGVSFGSLLGHDDRGCAVILCHYIGEADDGFDLYSSWTVIELDPDHHATSF